MNLKSKKFKTIIEMKKTTMILALALGMGFVFNSAVKAIHPMQFNGMILNYNTGNRLEEEIRLEDWMLSVDSFYGTERITADSELKVSSWMLEASWGRNGRHMASEPDLKLEDWMLKSFDRNNSTIALEDWMLDMKLFS
jgi:hypothetical protein